MASSDAFDRWSLAERGDAPPAEVLAEAGRLLEDAARAAQPTLVELDGGYLAGWHPLLGRFRVAPKLPGAPAEIPAWLAALDDARHVHAGGEQPETAIAALLLLVRETSGKL